jgi:hypothetical protein
MEGRDILKGEIPGTYAKLQNKQRGYLSHKGLICYVPGQYVVLSTLCDPNVGLVYNK